MTSAHLNALNAKHARIEGQIVAEMNRPMPDSTEIARLKREKLKLKEQITSVN